MMAAAPKRQSEDNVGGAKKEKKLGEADLEIGWAGKSTKVETKSCQGIVMLRCTKAGTGMSNWHFTWEKTKCIAFESKCITRIDDLRMATSVLQRLLV